MFIVNNELLFGSVLLMEYSTEYSRNNGYVFIALGEKFITITHKIRRVAVDVNTLRVNVCYYLNCNC